MWVKHHPVPLQGPLLVNNHPVPLQGSRVNNCLVSLQVPLLQFQVQVAKVLLNREIMVMMIIMMMTMITMKKKEKNHLMILMMMVMNMKK